MRYAFASLLAAVCTLSIVSAQTPAAPAGQDAQKPSAPATQSSSASAGKVTYTGCLKPGTAADSWQLENAEMAAAGGAKAEGATATSGAKQTLSLNVKPTENIKPHANHKIEVTGTMGKPAAGGAASSASATPTFTVESFKMVSATCP
jgi:hypothetical protein